jgi:hypothetical protein
MTCKCLHPAEYSDLYISPNSQLNIQAFSERISALLPFFFIIDNDENFLSLIEKNATVSGDIYHGFSGLNFPHHVAALLYLFPEAITNSGTIDLTRAIHRYPDLMERKRSGENGLLQVAVYRRVKEFDVHPEQVINDIRLLDRYNQIRQANESVDSMILKFLPQIESMTITDNHFIQPLDQETSQEKINFVTINSDCIISSWPTIPQAYAQNAPTDSVTSARPCRISEKNVQTVTTVLEQTMPLLPHLGVPSAALAVATTALIHHRHTPPEILANAQQLPAL